jgi:SpoIID/LytB domain protein
MRALSRRTAAAAAAALTAVLAASLAVALPGPADAARVRQVFTVPAIREFTVTGHGFGHGIGMSQYGARGAAAARKMTAAQILDYYYPGTTTARFSGALTVLITSDTTRDVQVRAQSGLSVRDRGTGKVYPLPVRAGVTRWRLNVVGTRAVVGYFKHGWHPYKLAGKRYLVGDGEFSATSRVLTLVTPKGAKVLRGTLRAASPRPGSTDRDTVNVVSMESYLRGVVPAEMPASWPAAAVQAQAVAARSYALFERAAHLHRYYQLCDTTACQVYGGVAVEHPLSDKAVAATAGQYRAYQGAPAFTQFSASSGGRTAAGGFAYLPAQADPYDGLTTNSYHRWTRLVRAHAFEVRYPKLGQLRTITITARDGAGEWGGRVQTVVLAGTKDGRATTQTITGSDFRFLAGLPSTWFTLPS